MVNYPVYAGKCALLVFDMSNDFIKPGSPRENPEIREYLLPKLKKLIAVCHAQGIPVIFTQHGHRKDGSDMGIMGEIWPQIKEGKMLVEGTEGIQVHDGLKLQKGDIILQKLRYSAFHDTHLEMILRNKGRDTLIITGATLNIGCETTARDATNRDFKVVFPSDGNLARDLPDLGWGPVSQKEILKVSLTTLAHAFARVMTVDELIAELNR